MGDNRVGMPLRWKAFVLMAAMAGCSFDPSGASGGGGGDSDGGPGDDGAPPPADAAAEPDATPPPPACDAPWKEEPTGCHQYVKNVTASFDNAQLDCAGRGGHLVVEDALDEYLAVATGMGPLGEADRFWIGLHDPAPNDNVFVWITGEALGGDTHWAGTEPSNSGDCVNARPDGIWGDRDCGELKWYVCEKND